MDGSWVEVFDCIALILQTLDSRKSRIGRRGGMLKGW